VLEAALALFNERGFRGTPMPVVAERAGVGAGTIYRHFASKEELGNAVFRACKLEMHRHLAGSSAPVDSPRAGFRALWRGLWEFARKSPAAFRFLETHHHAPYLDDESRAVSDALFGHVTDFVRRAQAAGALRAGDPALLIAMAFGAFVGLVKEADLGRFALDEQAIAASEEAAWSMLRA
jgi:AcrR family transcriptional regulator